jgi:uncharacterized membrane protein YjgN (DUF898 family)
MSDITGGGYLPQTLARPAGALPEQQFEYHGRLGPLYWLFIKNILLSSITFGIYRFWGRTNIRRYIWSNTRFMGDAFEYTGKGSELFAGFLIVFGIFFVTSTAIQILIVGLGPDSPVALILNVAFPIFVGYFIFVAQYAAQRYRLTRTVWRGLRGGMTGSAWSYGGYAFGVTLLTAFTLTLARPWARARLIERRLSNSYFGDAKVSVAFSSRPLYPSYIAGLVAFAIGAGVVGYIIYTALAETNIVERFMDLIAAGSHDDGGFGQDDSGGGSISGEKTSKQSNEEEVAKLIFQVIGLYIAVVVILALYAAVCFAWFDAATARLTAENSTFQDLRFSSSATGEQIAWLIVGNTLLILLTLYLAYPIVVQRTLRFITRHCHMHGTLDVERLRQNTLVKSRTGEGLLEVFDPGLF